MKCAPSFTILWSDFVHSLRRCNCSDRETHVIDKAHEDVIRDVDYNPNKPYHVVTAGPLILARCGCHRLHVTTVAFVVVALFQARTARCACGICASRKRRSKFWAGIRTGMLELLIWINCLARSPHALFANLQGVECEVQSFPRPAGAHSGHRQVRAGVRIGCVPPRCSCRWLVRCGRTQQCESVEHCVDVVCAAWRAGGSVQVSEQYVQLGSGCVSVVIVALILAPSPSLCLRPVLACA